MIHKVFLFLLALHLQLFGAHYNTTIIELEAKLFPKMLVLSTDQSINASKIELVILAKEEDEHYSEFFVEKIKESYAQKIMNKELLVSTTTFEKLQGEPDGIIVLYHSDRELKHIAKWANERKIPTFAYDPAHLAFGIFASLYIGAQTKPYLNKEIIKKYCFKINPHLIMLSKFY